MLNVRRYSSAMKTILIKVPKAAEDYGLVSNLRNLAEDVYREFTLYGIAEVPDMDSATTELHIFVPATRDLGTVTTFLKKALRRNGLADLAEVSRLDRSKSKES